MGRREHWHPANFFDWIEVVRDLPMDPTTKYVGIMLATYATYRTGENAHPGIAGLCETTGYGSKGTITKALDKLREMGLIQRNYTAAKGGRSKLADEYQLTMHNEVRIAAGHKPCYCGGSSEST